MATVFLLLLFAALFGSTAAMPAIDTITSVRRQAVVSLHENQPASYDTEYQTTTSPTFIDSATDSGAGSGSRRCARRQYHLNGNSGYLKSPNYPRSYSNNEDYEVTVTLDQPGPQTVYLSFDDFNVEWNAECAFDYVIINDDVSNKLCGHKPGERMEVEVPDDTFTLTFHSDSSIEGRGFNIHYTSSQGPREVEQTQIQ